MKDVVITVAALDNLFREYTDITGKAVDDYFKKLRLIKIVPEALRHQMQTVVHNLKTYHDMKDYAVTQARVAKNEKAVIGATPKLDAATNAEAWSSARPDDPPWTQEENEQYMMFVKGGGGKGKKGGKGSICYNCG